MAGNIRRFGILVALSVLMLLGMAQLALSYSEVGLSSRIEVDGIYPDACELSAVPPSVVDDAAELATGLFGDYQEGYRTFVDQLLAAYVEARDKDFIVVFNPGGWGWNVIDSSPGWCSIFNGIKSELDCLGYTSLWLNYQRTGETLRGRLSELVEMVTFYPSKAENLACRVEFLTRNIPELRVIIAGESNGTVLSDRTMDVLRQNPKVYSIQTDPPFWHRNVVQDRTLLLNHNGVVPDAFSDGDIPLMLWETLKASFGLSPPEEDTGRILSVFRAPGHEYCWQHPNVCSQITLFIEKNFGFKK